MNEKPLLDAKRARQDGELSQAAFEQSLSNAVDSVHVVIVTFNCFEFLKRCLQSLDSELIKSIVVVDNSSSAAERGKIASLGETDSRVSVFAMTTNLGFGAGVNRGLDILEATADDYVWVLNPDTEVEDGCVENLVGFVGQGRADIASPVVLTGQQRDQIWFGGGSVDFAKFRTSHHQIGQNASLIEVMEESDFLSGSALFAKLSTWRALNGFREDFFLYWEDADLAIRAVKMGLRLAVAPDSAIWHAVGGTSGAKGKSAIYYFHMQRNRIFLAKECMGMLSKSSIYEFPLETARICARALREDEQRLSKLKESIRGVCVGLISKSSATRSNLSEEKKSMKVLILWADEKSANLGVRVLAEGSAELVRGAYADSLVTFQDFSTGDSGINIGRKNVVKDIFSRKGPIKSFLAGFDLVVDTGAGDSFTDIYGLERLMVIVYTRYRAFRLGVPVVLGPQTIGPFNTWFGRLVAVVSMKMVRAVITRDSVSDNYAKKYFKGPKFKSSDVVFGLEAETDTSCSDILVNVSGLLWHTNDHTRSSMYRAQIRELIDQLLQLGRGVTLMAHVLESGKVDNDVSAIRDLMCEYKDDGRVTSVVPVDLQHARRVIAGSNLVIATRMHACLNALSQGVPALAWAYSRKFEPLMMDLGWPYVINLSDEAHPAARSIEILAEGSVLDVEQIHSVRTAGRQAFTAASASLRAAVQAR
ncbi:glycosyltransferase [Rhodococcus fascians]|uniref:glycosyltransferase n=1 Tax=Rhodococcoides fascians TaxID=1828 RepID=UPI001956187F|nr:glycosyltransferase [Rhodococcus fascians]MBM7241660.1 glycosyltransferase [Rhodococcus fascians]MBY3808364.1 glycosyltransferase [Rhodococcus fascians]MBY3839808.1 glycosyltransferase [Rhodococcus fascians]MBY3846671.1 glycosyltransferase [Rhodococcus fascians]MBY3848991.1 glycosyltransferase [Rhodococcus fascians]